MIGLVIFGQNLISLVGYQLMAQKGVLYGKTNVERFPRKPSWRSTRDLCGENVCCNWHDGFKLGQRRTDFSNTN
jgi:hypothetical protein